MVSPDQLVSLLPLACHWAEEQESIILREGSPLTAAQILDAKTIGVLHPDQVRLLRVKCVPIPANPVLRVAAEATHLISRHTAGLTLRYGIFIRDDCWDDRSLVFHELVHTLQYERFGGFRPFLQQYLLECLTIGYPAAPLEQEAIITTARLCT